MKPPKWLRTDVVLAMHDRLLAEHGGSAGIRDAGLLESALARPQNLLAYGKPSLFDLAAAYACGMIKNHPFVDGNKRTGFMAAFVFLGINKIHLAAAESDVVVQTLAVAAGELDEASYGNWLEENSTGQRRRTK
ncbi:MAG TPA: type II toxin-antitoxin system death-on-curing family toxin [Verrucomicrobiae bacterium]|nr:type II toxin-antitoxin system death-on-curing family toxin [Verrucomicrobiae bacterium]